MLSQCREGVWGLGRKLNTGGRLFRSWISSKVYLFGDVIPGLVQFAFEQTLQKLFERQYSEQQLLSRTPS